MDKRSGCIGMGMSDAVTGVVYDPPVSDGGLTLPMLVFPKSAGRAAETEWRRDSRLMIIRATPHRNPQDAVSYAFYFFGSTSIGGSYGA